jgi:hypothetical protein
MDKNPEVELKKVISQRENFIQKHFGSKIRDAKKYGILTNAHRCYNHSHRFTEEFINYFQERITPKGPVIKKDLYSLRFDDNLRKPTLCYIHDPKKETYSYTGGPVNQAHFELWERFKVLIPVISEAMEDWIKAKKKMKLDYMTKSLDRMTQSKKPYVKYKLTKIEISSEGSHESEKNKER